MSLQDGAQHREDWSAGGPRAPGKPSPHFTLIQHQTHCAVGPLGWEQHGVFNLNTSKDRRWKARQLRDRHNRPAWAPATHGLGEDGRELGLRIGPVAPPASASKAAWRRGAPRALEAVTKGQRAPVPAVPSPSGLASHVGALLLRSSFFLIYVSCGKSEEKPWSIF